jgi:hypothetical protein
MRTVLCFLGLCALVACGGKDPAGQGSTQTVPQLLPPNAGSVPSGSNPSSPSGDDSSGDDAGGSAPAPVVDAGPPPVNDPVVPGTPVDNPSDAFSGAGSYTSNPPTIRANDQHAGGVQVTGKPCLTCHDGTTCVKFDFAGTVWQYPALTNGAPDVQVRIIDNNDIAYSVYSDVDGNFWHRADTDLALPAFSGVRTSDWKAIGMLNGVSCNSCHYAGNTDSDAPPGPQLYVQQ